MRKIVVALAMLPAVGHAGLIVTDSPRQKPAAVAQMAPTIAPDTQAVRDSDASGFVDLRDNSRLKATDSAAIKIVAVPPPPPIWVAHQGSTLRQALTDWAVSAGWKVRWEARQGDRVVNYPIRDVDVTLQGPLESVVGDFIRLYEQAPDPLKVAISPSQKLFIITLKH